MNQTLSETISVSLLFDSTKRRSYPRSIKWNGRVYSIDQVGLHYTYLQGSILYHVFSVVSNNLFFRLVLNTQTLHWSLEEMADGLSY